MSDQVEAGASPGEARKIRPVLIACSIMTCLSFGGIAYLVPKCLELFSAFEVKLPALTSIFLSVPPALWIIVGVAVAVAILLLDRWTTSRSRKLAELSAIVLMGALVIATILALFMPIFTSFLKLQR